MSIQDYHLTQPCPSEEKQTKTQHKLEIKNKTRCQVGNKAMKTKLTNILRAKERKQKKERKDMQS